MSNGARHGLGVVIGLVVTPIIAACMTYGTVRLGQFARIFAYQGSDRWIGGGLILLAAVLIGLVAGSRVSPLASLIPGFVYTVVGLLWVFAPRWAFRHAGRDFIPYRLGNGYLTLSSLGVFLLLGVALVVASVAPSRWQARTGVARGAGPRFGGPPPAPMGPPMHQQPMHQPMHSPMQAPMQGAPMQQAPMHGAPPQLGAPQPPPGAGSPGASTPPWQGVPQYGQPPAQPSAPPSTPNPPPLPSASPPPPADDKPPSGGPSASDDDEPGEWTRMYGGNR
ncbi:hypothetical protein ACFOY4_07045 [Actinomadura syzygii]|uniref:hypothetical protein n=1 Tax=Actinomadura syzygii TaxID=1427538 RepID=UPI0016524ABA|nr:hypothetical protein [Actinomadura syzygii]